MSISRVSEPTDEGPKVPFLRRVKSANESYSAVALANAIFWLVTHFDLAKEKTFPCHAERDVSGTIIDSGPCKRCTQQHPIRTRGYLHVWSILHRREEFLEVTPCTWSTCKMSWPAVPSLRGWRIVAVRGNGRTARLSLTLEQPSLATDMKRMPKEKSPVECLENSMT
jgi:hypothetical protein